MSKTPQYYSWSSQCSTSQFIDVRIYVEDCRFTPAQKTVAILSLPVLDRKDCALDGFRVLAREIIARLQSSNSAIEIPFEGSWNACSIPILLTCRTRNWNRQNIIP